MQRIVRENAKLRAGRWEVPVTSGPGRSWLGCDVCHSGQELDLASENPVGRIGLLWVRGVRDRP